MWVDSMAEGKATPSRSGPFCFYGPQQELPIDGLEVGSHRYVDAEVFVAITSVILASLPPTSKWEKAPRGNGY